MKVIVVGATGTIGAEVVKALAAKGHNVVSASRHSNIKVDIENAASIRAMFDIVHDADAVACCAGDATFKPFLDLDNAGYGLGLRSKLMGQVTLARIATDCLCDGGSIVLTAGALARDPMVGSAAISLVNAGLEGFVRAAALEMPRRLRINAVSPPWVTETLVRLGMSSAGGLAAADVARAYLAAVEGVYQGAVLDPCQLS